MEAKDCARECEFLKIMRRPIKSNKNKSKLIVILGQTSTGKSDLGVYLAKKLNGEIISADSRQVYKGLDLGTGKITKKEMRGVPHHLLDIASPKRPTCAGRQFSVAEYKKLADKKIKEIIGRGKMPILVGGTGFYIQAVVDGIVPPEVPPNPELRKQLGEKSPEELLKMLGKLDPERALTVEPKNPRRLIRAIEIASALGKVPKIKKKPRYESLQIGLKVDDEKLKKKISIRLFERIREGMVDEAKHLHKKGLSWKRMEELGLEYRYLARYLQGKITKEEMIEQLNTAIWHYARRQKTWFTTSLASDVVQPSSRIHWFTAGKKSEKKKIEKLVEEFLKNKKN